MLNIGPQELLLILVVALLVVGPRRLPELGRSLGKGIRELRKAQEEVRKTIQVNLDEEEPRTSRRRGERTDEAGRERGRAAGVSEPARGGDVASGAAEPPVEPSATSEVADVSKTLGRGLAELRRAREELQRSFRVEIDAPASRGRGGRPRTKRSTTPPANEPAATPPRTQPAATPPPPQPAADRAKPTGPAGGETPG